MSDPQQARIEAAADCTYSHGFSSAAENPWACVRCSAVLCSFCGALDGHHAGCIHETTEVAAD